ncbi:MAG: Response regulator consisting of a CheY-like receiver domain and a winged-helix DNA-binding domain [Chthonomonadaceae bacterium]|nr:Response regulator consisting of a CheY-like receiver domain and a winged-helix DNA-binding domain [Chthonomonadaceae bacterium]
MNVRVVEDDESVARFLGQALRESGYVVELVNDGLTGLDRAQSLGYDLILLDVMLPGMNGLEVCRRLRSANISTPILVITARDTLQDRVDGLDSGADDYIVKPFQLAELLARARALLRRAVSAPTVLRVADLTLDPSSRRAIRAGKTITLSATEYALLEYLMRNVNRVLTRSMILEHVWQYDFGGSDNVLDVYISYLRGKIDRGQKPTLIHTVRGVGFRLGVEDGG